MTNTPAVAIPEQFKETFRKLDLKWKLLMGSGAVILFGAITPYILWGLLGMGALIVGGVLAASAIAFAPIISMKLANKKLQLIMAEAMKNPIETKWNIYSQRITALEGFAEGIEAFNGKIKKHTSTVHRLKQQYPNDPQTLALERFVNEMDVLRVQREEEYKKTASTLIKYKASIEKDQAFWDAALEAKDLKNASGATRLSFMQEFADKAASNAVELEVNAAFAQMDRIMMERIEEPAEIPQLIDQSRVIDVTPKSKTYEKVRS